MALGSCSKAGAPRGMCKTRSRAVHLAAAQPVPSTSSRLRSVRSGMLPGAKDWLAVLAWRPIPTGGLIAVHDAASPTALRLAGTPPASQARCHSMRAADLLVMPVVNECSVHTGSRSGSGRLADNLLHSPTLLSISATSGNQRDFCPGCSPRQLHKTPATDSPSLRTTLRPARRPTPPPSPLLMPAACETPARHRCQRTPSRLDTQSPQPLGWGHPRPPATPWCF